MNKKELKDRVKKLEEDLSSLVDRARDEQHTLIKLKKLWTDDNLIVFVNSSGPNFKINFTYDRFIEWVYEGKYPFKLFFKEISEEGKEEYFPIITREILNSFIQKFSGMDIWRQHRGL